MQLKSQTLLERSIDYHRTFNDAHGTPLGVKRA
jgi:hypothetical protein